MTTGTADSDRALLSPGQAARLLGIGRSSIMRALTAGDLVARRDNRNRWQIERADLDRWEATRPDSDRTGPDSDQNPLPSPDRSVSADTTEPLSAAGEGRGVEQAELLALTTRAVAAETRVEMMTEQMAELRQARDRELAELRQKAERELAELRQDRDRELAELRQDRDHWRTLADRLAGAVPKPVIEPEPTPEPEPELVVEPVVEHPSKSWWRRLLRRGQ